MHITNALGEQTLGLQGCRKVEVLSKIPCAWMFLILAKNDGYGMSRKFEPFSTLGTHNLSLCQLKKSLTSAGPCEVKNLEAVS